VTISKDGSVIGTVVADGNGDYDQTFPAQEPGLHELQLFAHTTGGNNTDAVSINVNIMEHATTSVTVFLPSTMQVSDTSLAYGQQLDLQGEAAPSSTIAIYVDGTVYATASTDAQGVWSTSLPTMALAPGQHAFFVRVSDGIGNQSYPTSARSFSLEAQPGKPGEPSPPQLPRPSRSAPHIPSITFPQAGAVWRQPIIEVRGSADKHVQVELWDDTRIIGSVWSDASGAWSMQLSLEAKEYALRARACLNQRCSAFSPVVRFTYEPEGAIPPHEGPLLIHVPQSHFTVYQNQAVSLLAFVLNGQPPHKSTIDWGDGAVQKYMSPHDGLSFLHVYTKPGKYAVTVDVQDAQGKKNRIYFSIEVKPNVVDRVTSFLILILLAIAILCLWLARKRRKAQSQSREQA
jgi:hypothetical protein